MRASQRRKNRQLADSIYRDGVLRENILRYGYAATIEVTNNLTDVIKENRETHEIERVRVYDDKARQVRTAKEFLEGIVGDSARIDAGLVYNGDPVDPPDKSGLDFLIDINRYEPDRLEEVAEEMLGYKYLRMGRLNNEQIGILRKILAKRNEKMPITGFFSTRMMGLCAEFLGEDPTRYQFCLRSIKGLCMELYLKSLFEDEIREGIIYHSYSFRYGRDHRKDRLDHEADEIIVCREDEFYAALKNISEKGHFDTWVRIKEES